MSKKRLVSLAVALGLTTFSVVSIAPSANAACSSYKLIFQGGITGDAAQTGIGEYNGFKFAIKKYTDSNPSVTVTGDRN
jgi:hypothetical protein